MSTHSWQAAALEEANCFRCGVHGERLYSSDRFGVVRCPTCGQAFISPRLAEQGRESVYDADYFEAGVYGYKKRFSISLWHQQTWSNGRLKLIRNLLDGEPAGKRLLEIGCAYGFFLNVAEEQGFKVSGVEYSKPAVAWAQKHTKLDIRQGTVETVTLPAQEFDVACFWDVFEHVPDPRFFLQVITRALKPGGIVAMSCPNFGSAAARTFRGRWWTLRPEQHLWQFTPETLARAFDEAGLTDVRIITSFFAPANFGRADSLVATARLKV